MQPEHIDAALVVQDQVTMPWRWGPNVKMRTGPPGLFSFTGSPLPEPISSEVSSSA